MKKAVSIIIASIMILSVLAFSGVFSAYHYLGDVNADGAVDNKDVVALFRFVSKSASNAIEENCDVNADGSIDNKDVTVLFRSTSNNGSSGAGADEWRLGDYVDTAGNKTGVHYIYTVGVGTYTNKTKTDGVLYGAVMIDKQGDNFYLMIRLFLESTENQIVNTTGTEEQYSVRIQTSVGMVLPSTGTIYPNSDRIFLMVSDVPVVMYELEHGKDLTFTVKPAGDPSTVYEFTVNSSNYRALIPEVDI